MDLYLHTESSENDIEEKYHQAFNSATELFVVTAYLTEWDSSLALNDKCKKFRLIIGKDFGITRKLACNKVLKWLPSNRKSQFLVADGIIGFHPKAIFWRESDDTYHSIIGSSNLTKAAFNSNYEANVYTEISCDKYSDAKNWINGIEKYSVVVSEDWLTEYNEGSASTKPNQKKKNKPSTINLDLPKPKGYKKLIRNRRVQVAAYNEKKPQIIKLIKKCNNKTITSSEFYDQLNEVWNDYIGNRLQGPGWERSGKSSDFHEFAKSFIQIINASKLDRDDIVSEEMDRLIALKVSTHRSFLSEMLCLRFPDLYPLLNEPVEKYLSVMKFKPPRGASSGSKYIDLSKKLRYLIIENPTYPAKNLAELDALIWLEYGNK